MVISGRFRLYFFACFCLGYNFCDTTIGDPKATNQGGNFDIMRQEKLPKSTTDACVIAVAPNTPIFFSIPMFYYVVFFIGLLPAEEDGFTWSLLQYGGLPLSKVGQIAESKCAANEWDRQKWSLCFPRLAKNLIADGGERVNSVTLRKEHAVWKRTMDQFWARIWRILIRLCGRSGPPRGGGLLSPPCPRTPSVEADGWSRRWHSPWCAQGMGVCGFVGSGSSMLAHWALTVKVGQEEVNAQGKIVRRCACCVTIHHIRNCFVSVARSRTRVHVPVLRLCRWGKLIMHSAT